MVVPPLIMLIPPTWIVVVVVNMIIDTSIFVDSKVYDTRMDICISCDQLGEWKKCKLCGCFMDLKSRLKFASCPLGKWNSVETGIGSI